MKTYHLPSKIISLLMPTIPLTYCQENPSVKGGLDHVEELPIQGTHKNRAEGERNNSSGTFDIALPSGVSEPARTVSVETQLGRKLTAKEKGEIELIETKLGGKLAADAIGRIILLEAGLRRKLSEDEVEGILIIEQKLQRRLTIDEIHLKPNEFSWENWMWELGVHQIKAAKNGPITFFGKIVTHDGKPLGGVHIQAEIHFYIESLEDAVIKEKFSERKVIKIIADEDGRFKISDENGSNLKLFQFQKEGWQFASEKNFWSKSFDPNSPNLHHPDPEKPVEFVMKKVE